jgi:cytochrome c biogenesis protein CcdA
MNVWEFLQKGQWAYQGPGSLIYFATLAAYAGAKETHQWTQGESQAELKGRKGILFVGVWVVFSMGTFVAVNLGKGYIFPHELLTITLEVLGIFFGTQASKALRQRKGIAAKAVGIEEGILQLARDSGGAGTSLITDRLGADRNTVQYAVRKMVKEGRLRKVGDKNDTKYEVV